MDKEKAAWVIVAGLFLMGLAVGAGLKDPWASAFIWGLEAAVFGLAWFFRPEQGE